ncbi:MAG: GUN4 domain-containing protein [Cyanobacteria bacterium P01_C01_bin.121]
MAPDPSPEKRYIQKAVDAFIQWSPLGGSGWAFFHFLLQQDWMLAVLTFPAMIVTAVWAKYTGNFTTRLGEIAGEKGTKDADALAALLDRLDRALRWQISGVDSKYLAAQGIACQRYVAHNEVQIPTGIQNPDLEDVYVSLKLSGEFLRNLEGQALPMLPGYGEKSEEMLEQLQSRQTQSIWELLAQGKTTPQFRRLAILAYGGFGKTTLLRHITYFYTTRPWYVRRRRKTHVLTPFLIYLRKWRDLIAKDDAPDLPTLITQHHAQSFPQCKSVEIPNRWADKLLNNGRALVMLDGFDEVAEEQRKAISHWITVQMQTYPKATFILTSRPTAYNNDYAAEKVLTPLALQPFDEDQRQNFVKQWYLCQERLQRGNQLTEDVRQVAAERSEDLLAQINNRPELESMAENPLMLNMIAMFHRSYPTEQLPKQQDQLYREICKLQLGDRPMAKRVALPLPAEASQAVLQQVALAMTQQEQTTIGEVDLLAIIRQGLSAQEELIDPKAFLESVEQVSELLVKKDDGYEFAHRSFQEYLAATEIKTAHQEDLLLQHFEEEYWKGTILLYAAQANPTNLLTTAYPRSPATASLAYDCTKVTRRRLDAGLVGEINRHRYLQLEGYLAEEEWQKADHETRRLMLQTYSKELGNFLSAKELLNFPCEDLLRLDELWLRYSNGHFGFSVQKDIYLSKAVGGVTDGKYYKEAFERFGDVVKWNNGASWAFKFIYDISAPKGHLPSPPMFTAFFPHFFCCVSSRIETCKV